MAPRNFDRTELLEVRRGPLSIEQGKLPRLQMFDQTDQRDLRRVAHAVKHRFAKKRPADCHTVKPAREFVVRPCLDRMGVPELVQTFVAFDDLIIDPGIFSFRATEDHFTERLVDLDFENVFSKETPQSVRNVKILQRNDRAWIGREPGD